MTAARSLSTRRKAYRVRPNSVDELDFAPSLETIQSSPG